MVLLLVLLIAGFAGWLGSSPVRAAGTDPVAVLFVDPLVGDLSTLFLADGTGSYDPDPIRIIANYTINWGDGTTLPDAFGFHNYSAPGTYVVMLTVTNDLGASNSTTQTVQVKSEPVAVLTVTPLIGNVTTVFTADGSASTDDVAVVSSSIDWGDGASSPGPVATHTYDRIGDFTVNLTVTDDRGLTNSTTQTVQVRSRAPSVGACRFFPDPRFSESFGCAPLSANGGRPAFIRTSVPFEPEVVFEFNVSDPDGDNLTVTTYFEYLGPGYVPNPASPRNVTNVTPPSPGTPYSATVRVNFTYLELGPYTILPNQSSRQYFYINVTDEHGESATRGPFSLVVNRNSKPEFGRAPPEAQSIPDRILFPDAVVPPFSLNFTLFDVDNDTVDVLVDWGDGTPVALATTVPGAQSEVVVVVEHTFDVPLNISGRTVTFDVNVTLDDGVGRDARNMSYANTLVDVTIARDFWPGADLSFGNLNVSAVTIRTPEHISSWKVGEAIPFEGTATDPEGQPIVAYFWTFGDGSATLPSASGNKTTHVYDSAGTYDITFNATDGLDKKTCFNLNCTVYLRTDHWGTRGLTIYAIQNRAPFVVATNVTSGRLGSPVLMNAGMIDPDGDNLTVVWDFGDGTPIAQNYSGSWRQPGDPIPGRIAEKRVLREHNYTQPGFYLVNVTVSDGEFSVKTNATVFVGSTNLWPVVIVSTQATNNTVRLNESFSLVINVTDEEGDRVDLSINWADHTWTNLSANTTVGNATFLEVNHTYTQPGGYNITVTATDHMVYYALRDWDNRTVEQFNHTVVTPVRIEVRAPVIPEVEPPWDWWDYSTLAAVLGVPAFLGVRSVLRTRKERLEE